MQMKNAKLREVATSINVILNEATIGKDINVATADFLIELSCEVEDLLEGTQAKLKMYNESVTKTNKEFEIPPVDENSGPTYPKDGENKNFDDRKALLKETIETIMNGEQEVKNEKKILNKDFPAVSYPIYKKVLRPWIDFTVADGKSAEKTE